MITYRVAFFLNFSIHNSRYSHICITKTVHLFCPQLSHCIDINKLRESHLRVFTGGSQDTVIHTTATGGIQNVSTFFDLLSEYTKYPVIPNPTSSKINASANKAVCPI